MTEQRGTYEVGGVVRDLQDDDPANDRLERPAIAFALALGVARVVGGLLEVLLPKTLLTVLTRRSEVTDGAAASIRMKGGRDLAIGLMTLGAAASGDRSAVAQFTAMGVVIDAVDGAAVSRGDGAFRRPLDPLGAWAGYAVAGAAAVAAWILGNE